MSKKSKMLNEAIADAKAVRETAMANAKLALQEAFTPQLQSMLSAKLQQEMDDEEMEGEDEEDFGAEMDSEVDAELDGEVPAMDDELEDEVPMDDEFEDEVEEGMYSEEDEMEDEVPAGLEDEEDEEEDLELESIIRELEEELNEEDEVMDDEPESSAEDEAMDDDDLYEEIDINEIIAALREDLDGDGMPDEGEAMDDDTAAGESLGEVTELQTELEEAYNTIESMRSTLTETNLLNAKLLFSNKLFKAYDLNESQKLKVIDNFDRAGNLREVKLVYTTLAESFKMPTKRRVNESASRATASTAPKKEIISETADFSSRMQKLAGIKK